MKISLNNFKIFFILFGVFGFPFFVTINLLLGTDVSQGSIIYRALLVFFSLVIIFISIAKRHRLRLDLLILFLFIYSIRLIYDLYYRDLTSPFISQNLLSLFYFGNIVIPVLALSYSNINMTKLNTAFLYTSLIQCAVILIGLYLLFGSNLDQLLLDRYLFTSENINSGKGSPLNPILVSRFGGVLFVLLSFNVLYKKIKLPRYLTITGFTLSIILLLLGGSRGPFVVSFFLSILIAFFYLKNSNIYNSFISSIGLSILVVVLFFLINVYSKSIGLIDRLNNSILNSNQFNYGREDHFNAAFNQFINNPFFGDQIFDSHLGSYPHNIFLESFMALGFFGGLILAYLIFKNIFKGFRNYKANIYLTFLCFTLFALTSGAIWNSFEFWILLVSINNKRLQLSY